MYYISHVRCKNDATTADLARFAARSPADVITNVCGLPGELEAEASVLPLTLNLVLK